MEKREDNFVTASLEIEYNQHLPVQFTVKHLTLDNSLFERSFPAHDMTGFQQIFDHCLAKQFFMKMQTRI